MLQKLIATILTATQLLFAATPTAAAAGKTFSDVKQGDWYYQTVTQMAHDGWLSGYKDGSFKPNRKISGAEFITIVTKRTGAQQGSGQSAHWASGWMQTALERGWYDWDEFPPTAETYDKPITRQVAVKVLMKALLPGTTYDYNTESQKIKDFSQVSGRYYEGVLGAYAAGVVSGYKDGGFHPNGSLTRAEACSMICKATSIAGGTLPDTAEPEPGPVETIKGGVSQNGALQVKGTQLCNENGDPIALHGMSTHGMQWYDQYASSGAIKTTAAYGANLFRVAMYTGEGGYLSDPKSMEQKVVQAVDAAIANDLYVIIDWHVLSDGNPKDHLKEAKAFFASMAERYRDEPAVLYEICNEPNGGVSWKNDVKPYAQEIVKTIRGAGADGVILIGSPTWSQDIHLAADDPVSGENLMYTLHFYAGTHGKELRDRIDAAMKKGIGIFVSEWGTSRADGNGGVFTKEADAWLDFLDQKGISWANWSLCDKSETSAALRPGASPNGGWKQNDLSESGKYVFSKF